MNASCECSGIECDTIPEEALTPTADDLKEYCIVSSIESILTNMVERFADDKHVDYSSEDLVCRVDFQTRKEMQKIETSVNSYALKVC